MLEVGLVFLIRTVSSKTVFWWPLIMAALQNNRPEPFRANGDRQKQLGKTSNQWASSSLEAGAWSLVCHLATVPSLP